MRTFSLIFVLFVCASNLIAQDDFNTATAENVEFASSRSWGYRKTSSRTGWHFRFFSDNKRAAFYKGSKIYVKDLLTNSDLSVFPVGAQKGFSFSPDEKKIFYINYQSKLFVYDIEADKHLDLQTTSIYTIGSVNFVWADPMRVYFLLRVGRGYEDDKLTYFDLNDLQFHKSPSTTREEKAAIKSKLQQMIPVQNHPNIIVESARRGVILRNRRNCYSKELKIDDNNQSSGFAVSNNGEFVCIPNSNLISRTTYLYVYRLGIAEEKVEVTYRTNINFNEDRFLEFREKFGEARSKGVPIKAKIYNGKTNPLTGKFVGPGESLRGEVVISQLGDEIQEIQICSNAKNISPGDIICEFSAPGVFNLGKNNLWATLGTTAQFPGNINWKNPESSTGSNPQRSVEDPTVKEKPPANNSLSPLRSVIPLGENQRKIVLDLKGIINKCGNCNAYDFLQVKKLIIAQLLSSERFRAYNMQKDQDLKNVHKMSFEVSSFRATTKKVTTLGGTEKESYFYEVKISYQIDAGDSPIKGIIEFTQDNNLVVQTEKEAFEKASSTIDERLDKIFLQNYPLTSKIISISQKDKKGKPKRLNVNFGAAKFPINMNPTQFNFCLFINSQFLSDPGYRFNKFTGKLSPTFASFPTVIDQNLEFKISSGEDQISDSGIEEGKFIVIMVAK